MISGSITTRDVLLNASAIVRSFGLGTYLRCLNALLTGRRTTFSSLPGRADCDVLGRGEPTVSIL